jgi:hypothetical protein
MSSKPRFENQLFISYAHIDNEHFSGSSHGWIDLLHERLEIRLAQLLGKSARIWRDRKLRGNDLFNDTLVIELSRTAILVSVITPRYVDSQSCRSEVEDFLGHAARNGGIRIGDKHRVFKVVKTAVATDSHPAGLRELLGYEFFHRDQASGRVREFDHEISSRGEKDSRYWGKFEDLAWDIHELIKLMEDSAPRAVPSGDTIYLAETTSDLNEERDKVKRELQQFGHVVLPDRELPLKGRDLREVIRDYLGRSRLSVHLIGEHYGVIPEMETEHSIVRMQQDLAIERGDDAGFSRLIWLPPGLAPKDERQRRFLAELQNSFTSRNGSELLQITLEDLKTIIKAKLTEKRKLEPPGKEDSGPARIYLICDQQDVDEALSIQNYLFDQGYEVTLPLLEGSEAEALQDHKENLLVCDVVFIFQGRASEGWLRMKLRELVKLPGYGRTAPLLAKAVYIGGPESPSKVRFKTLEATVIRDYGEFKPATLDPILAQLNRAKGAQS